MVELLRYLRVGRKVEAVLAKFSELPDAYVLGALEALERLGVVKVVEVQGEKFYVLTEEGKLILSYVEELRKSTV